jgi:multidrug efflux pump subunit AcrB
MLNLFHRRYLISLTYLLVVVIGIIAWRNIALETAPELNLPSITVSYSWGSTSPEVMEKEVTRQVEQAANRLRNVQQIQSISEEGRSSVTVTFNRNAPVDYRIVELQEYLFSLEETLPTEVRQGNISRRVPEELQDLQTFVVYSISGDRPVRDLLEYARQNIKLPLLGLSGLADIEINGARDPALTIEFNTTKLEQFGLEPGQILSDISSRLQWRSSGYAEASGRRISMLVPPQFEGVQSIRSMQLQLPNTQRRVRLGDLARISVQDYPAKSLKRINGSPALSLDFIKESGADALGLAERIQERVAAINESLPAGMTLQLEQDATEELRKQFDELQYQAMISLLVVFLVLLLFIRRFRAPFVILGSILFSLLLSVSILYFIGYTLNIITLAGLTVSLGMIIDNAVVVFEELNPKLPGNRSARFAHVRQHLPRTLVPVLGSTFTTVGIFIPLFFAMEELQLFLVPLAVALSFTLISSVFIALSWIPYALIWLVPGTDSRDKSRSTTNRKNLFEYIRRPMLWTFGLRHRLRGLFYGALILVIGVPLFAIDEPDWEEGTNWPEFTKVYFDNRGDIDPLIGGLPYRFFNDTYFGSPWGRDQQQHINITIRTPQGTPIEEIDKMARNYEKIVRPYAEAFSFFETQISEYSGARMVFYIKDEYLYETEPYAFYGEAQYLAARTGNSAISVSGLGDGISTGFGSSSSNQRISLTGYSYNELLNLANDLSRRLKDNRRVREVDINAGGWYSRDDLYQYYLALNDEELALRGLNRGDLLDAISLDINPTNTYGQVDINGTRMYLIGRNAQRQNYPESLMDEKRRVLQDSVIFALQEVANLGREKSQSAIRREDQAYQRTVGVDFLGPYRLAQEYIEQVIEETPVPVGATIEYGSGVFSFGQEEQNRNLLLLLGLTILSVWMIVSALLESWIDPLIVILAVPLSLLGVMMGSLYHDLAFDRGAIAGTLLCVGVVVNNAILLMHEKQHQRQSGIHGLRSWLYVYKNKMRAVLITTLTTIGGLVPMIVFGESEFWSQLATITVWGLSASTILLLVLMGIWERVGLAKSKIAL